MRKFRAIAAAVLAVGVLSVSTTACTTQPRTPAEQYRYEQWVASSIGGFVWLVLWDWYHKTFPCPTCL
jgi:hypothetical protein